MLNVYLGTLAFGATLLIVSLVMGGKDKDVGKDLDKDVSKDFDKDIGLDWLPVASMRFWTFLLAFGGLAGTLLTYAGSLSAPIVGVIAGVVGWGSGVAVVATLRSLRKGSVGSELSVSDLRGELAEVVVAIAARGIGKIRVNAKGRVSDLMAETDDEETIAIGAKVMVLGEGDEGRVQVTRHRE